MRKINIVLLVFCLLIFYSGLKAQNGNYQSLFCKSDTIIRDVKLYGSLLHQHQNFFNKPFSFTGIEGGILLNHKLFIGVFGSTFFSNLKANIVNNSMYLSAWQAGMSIGRIYNDKNVLHSGWQIKAGYFSLTGDYSNFKISMPIDPTITIDGLILSPEFFAELNISRWMKFRTGIAYSFYNFVDHTTVKKSDLQSVSLNFGFIFSNFE